MLTTHTSWHPSEPMGQGEDPHRGDYWEEDRHGYKRGKEVSMKEGASEVGQGRDGLTWRS